MSDEKYRLYAMHAGAMPSDAEFYFLLPEIDLVYSQRKPANSIEIDNPDQIPAEARFWLLETIEKIADRYLKENEQEILDGSKTFLDSFRHELEKESAKTTGKKKRKVRAKSDGRNE